MDLSKSTTPNSIEYNSILILINYFIKLIHYYPVRKIINIIQLTELLFRIFTQIGPPNNIIFNRGSVFTNKYQSTIYYHLRVQYKLSTTFHPQIDSQTERQNQELKAYLYIFTNWEQSNQASLLKEVAFTYNSKVYTIIKHSPIELAYGQLLNVLNRVLDGV